MKKIVFIFGTRPEVIKLYPVIKYFKRKKKYKVSVISTSQHRYLLDQFLKYFDLKLDIDLNLMKKNQKLEYLSSEILKKLSKILNKINPSLVVVQGDTTTSFVASLAAFYNKIKIAHVEAGLRTYDNYNPYPEEANRRMISNLADFHFTPTSLSRNNLIKEGIKKEYILNTGNTVIDSLLEISNKIKIVEDNIKEYYYKYHNIDFNDKKLKTILVTCHRRESFGSDVIEILKSLKKIILKNKNLRIIFPVHLNPNIKNLVYEHLNNVKNIYLLKPQSYLNFVFLMKNCYFIITDSGGIQEEAPTFKKPVIVIRKKTERLEGLKNKISLLAGTSQSKILKFVNLLLNNNNYYKKISSKKNPYGDGNASKRIYNFVSKNI